MIRCAVLLSFFGIEPTLYRQMFPDNLEIIAGEFLAPGEEGIMLSEITADQISKKLDRPVAPGDSILLTGMSLAGGSAFVKWKSKRSSVFAIPIRKLRWSLCLTSPICEPWLV